ncbi:hypothetical protein PO909_023240 [Leuciscus waleckii]
MPKDSFSLYSQVQTNGGCRFHRSYVIFTILLILSLCYYIIVYENSESWTAAVRLFLPETFHNKTTNVSLTTVSRGNVSLTTVSRGISAEPWKPPEPYYVAYPNNYIFVINEPEKCQKENTFVVLIIPVAPGNGEGGTERSVADKIISLLFLIGLPTSQDSEKLQEDLLQESEKYHDILQSNFWDSYYNLTIKTVVMLEWLSAYCQNASYAMKIDSDIFLNVKNLVNMLLPAPKQNYMTGLTVYSPALYPPYALGLGYVFSLDLAGKLVKAAQIVKPVYIEDVYVGMCMNHLGIALTDPPDGSLFNVFPVDYNRCRYSKLIATTTRSLNNQVDFWRDLQTPGPYC